MENYLIERDVLGKVVDDLIAEKFPDRPSSELETLREDSIKKLDDKIGKAVFGSLNKEQLKKVNEMLDEDIDDAAAFEMFFEEAGVDLNKVISDTITDFGQEFLGGENV